MRALVTHFEVNREPKKGRILTAALAAILLAFPANTSSAQSRAIELEGVLKASDLIILGDVKHGVRSRIEFLSSAAFFEAMARAGVEHVAIEMPRVLGRQAMGIETDADVEAFADDVIRSGRWHFVDPDHTGEESEITQHRVAYALGQQVLLAKRLGINPIFYDFNNPLGDFRTYNDAVYRCLAELSQGTWVKYGLSGRIEKADRDAAIMRERFSHDDELADFIVENVRTNGGGKLVVIPGYAHSVLPGGIADRLETLLGTAATVVAVFIDSTELRPFHTFLWEQSRLLSINLSRAPNYYYTIATDTLGAEDMPGRFAALDGTPDRKIPSVCLQTAGAN